MKATEQIAALVTGIAMIFLSCSKGDDSSSASLQRAEQSKKTSLSDTYKQEGAASSSSPDLQDNSTGNSTEDGDTAVETAKKARTSDRLAERDAYEAPEEYEDSDSKDRGPESPDYFDSSIEKKSSPAAASGPAKKCVLSWKPNRERGVNSPGGGYRIYCCRGKIFHIEKAVIVDVPYDSGDLAPTEAAVMLEPGPWRIRIAGFSSYNGGTEGLLSEEIPVTVKD